MIANEVSVNVPEIPSNMITPKKARNNLELELSFLLMQEC